jgi:hypothetical protein
MKRKHFAIYRVESEPEISYYIVKQRRWFFFFLFFTEPDSYSFYESFTGSYVRFKTIQDAEAAIERAIAVSPYPIITRVS